MVRSLFLIKILRAVGIAYASLCCFMWFYQDTILFQPHTPMGTAQAHGLSEFSDVFLTTKDGLRLQVWQHLARPGFPTIVFFHGNGGNLSDRTFYFQKMSEAGFGVLGLSYRGYGDSEGTPSEQGFYDDARSVIEYSTKTLSLKAENIILFGESIGTGVAVQMATEFPVAAVVLQSPYASIDDLARDNFPWLPVRLLVRHHFDSLSKIANIHAPLLVLHGERDILVPAKYGKLLFAQAKGPKEAHYFPDRGHSDFDIVVLMKMVSEFYDHYGRSSHIGKL